ncbi:MAG: hypothetical protein LUD72_12790, partial [Bacteroidales bacterium]|nr:hypothetical protein [Bacteroidales bacterium]
SAFYKCVRLKSVYFSGTPEDWREIKIEPFNDYLLSADLYYYSEEKPSEKGKFWHYLNGEPAKWDEDV